MKPANRKLHRSCAIFVVLLCATAAGWSIAPLMPPATQTTSAPTAVDSAVALWNKGEYSAAIAEFQKVIQQNPDDVALHTKFAFNASNASTKEARLKSERARALAAQQPPKQDAAPPVLSPEELAKMEADVKAANAALVQLKRIYEDWAKSHPKKAVYPYELGMLTDLQEFEKREQYFLQAVNLDPKFTDGYRQLMILNNGIDDAAAAKWAKKAAESKPDDFQLQLTHASALWMIDQAAARKYYRDLVARNAGTKNGSTALRLFASRTEDLKEKVALIEQFRREYPKDWTTEPYPTVYEQYLAGDPAKGLAYAQGILKDLESATPEPNNKSAQSAVERSKTWWKTRIDYAQALVQARTLLAGKKGADALALLEKTEVPPALEDSSQYTLLKAEAANASGDTAKAYDTLAAELVRDLNDDYRNAIVKYGARLGKSAKQVDEELWSRRLQKAEQFKEFDLPKLGGTERVKLSELRGKVVLVDFWFPG
jgi:tetratricopeptide (TPR) repeat protein